MLQLETAVKNRFRPGKETLALFHWEGETPSSNGRVQTPKTLPALIQSEAFRAKEGECLTLHPNPEQPLQKLLLVGLGKRKEFSLEVLRRSSGQLLKAARQKTQKFWIVPPEHPSLGLPRICQAIAEGL